MLVRVWARAYLIFSAGVQQCPVINDQAKNSPITLERIKIKSTFMCINYVSKAFFWCLNLLYTFHGNNIISVYRWMHINACPDATIKYVKFVYIGVCIYVEFAYIIMYIYVKFVYVSMCVCIYIYKTCFSVWIDNSTSIINPLHCACTKVRLLCTFPCAPWQCAQ